MRKEDQGFLMIVHSCMGVYLNLFSLGCSEWTYGQDTTFIIDILLLNTCKKKQRKPLEEPCLSFKLWKTLSMWPYKSVTTWSLKPYVTIKTQKCLSSSDPDIIKKTFLLPLLRVLQWDTVTMEGSVLVDTGTWNLTGDQRTRMVSLDSKSKPTFDQLTLITYLNIIK